jgi:uncharacterized SAM-binding protein YcdF (DUF218 family)
MKIRKKKILIIVLIIFSLVYLALAFFVAGSVDVDTDRTADAALVLGAKSYRGGGYNPCLVSRVLRAVELYKDMQVLRLVLSGGTDSEDGRNEAEMMREIAVQNGVREEDVVLERESTSTYENLLLSRKIMQKEHIESVVIVSEPFHMARIRLVSESLGLNASYSAAVDSPCWTRWKYLSRYFLKEPFSIIYYLLMGKISIF